MRYIALAIALVLVLALVSATSPVLREKKDGEHAAKKILEGIRLWRKEKIAEKKRRIPQLPKQPRKFFGLLKKKQADAEEQEEETLADSMQLRAGTLRTTTGVNMRSGPCTSYGVVTTLASGTSVSYSGQSQSGCGYTWYYVTTSSGSRGYVAGNYLSQSASPAPAPTPSWSAPSPAPSTGGFWGSLFGPRPAPAPTPTWGGWSPSPAPRPAPAPAASSQGQTAVNWAMSKVGGCYSQTTRDGNPCYDCSSFVYYAWRHAGKNIGATNTRMYPGNTRRISASELQPGDILWRTGHVAMFAGNGRIVHAANTAAGIKTDPFNASSWTAFYRP